MAHDILHVVDRIIPFNDNGYRHMEGNSAAHVKACLFGSLETVFIRNGRLGPRDLAGDLLLRI